MTIKYFFTLSIICCLLLNCDKINPVLKKADSIEITFYGREADKINTSYKKITITTPVEISKTIDFISGDDAPLYKCAYNGNISFLKEGKSFINNAEFNISRECPHIIFYIKGELISKEITDGGLVYLRNLYRQNVERAHWMFKL